MGHLKNLNDICNARSEIKLLIVDFDGTLVDTFRANFMAYQRLRGF